MKKQPAAYVTHAGRVRSYNIVIREHAHPTTKAEMHDVAGIVFTSYTAARLIAAAINQFDAGRK